MSKKKPRPAPRLSLTMKNFSFFAKDEKLMKEKLLAILEQGDYLILEMGQSTSLTNDLYILDCMMRHSSGKMDYGFQIQERYSNKPPQLVVYLSPDLDEKEESE